LKEIIQNGTPSLDEIQMDIKYFFEGPINMDLMILGTLKKALTKDSNSDEMK
jgi:hypothetical protein